MGAGDWTVEELAAAAAEALAYQAELGLEGVDVARAHARSPIRAEGHLPNAVGVAEKPSSPPVAGAPVAAVHATVDPLAAIRADLGDCQRCKLCRKRTHIVFGVGNPKARLMFIGEGPGRDEDLQGEPFVGDAGKLLNKMIAAMGLRRADVYIANVVKCRPPQNRDPEPDEVAACEPFLRAQVRAVRPEVIVVLGKVAVQTLLGDPTPIRALRGQWRELEGVACMPTFHPAYLLRDPSQKKLVWADLQLVMARLAPESGAPS